ncbi:methionine--tRNA ligase, mitochondrial-like isoform X2 [Corticium candelabrum]|uniref:methionine--tRNA ligase, mitochondrial-like isoform X2 n=1 Tax=Corticium candelabrum TaxID=121492 RepID=UPI002E25C928|nr:methionine--tRNA ligase, mitochondrial-like isoform X2 [Corticium candelabrum]
MLAIRRFVAKRSYSFVTTPIFYVNAAPHVGHVYSAVLADALHRWHRIQGKSPAIFSTGTDEHGLKVQHAAASQNMDPQLFCDDVSRLFKKLFNAYDVSYNDYVRTTERRHVECVEYFWNRLAANGWLYKDSYEGWYSVSDETFVGKSQVTQFDDEHGNQCMVSTETGNVVEWTKEENYMFRLSHFKEQLLSWLNCHSAAVYPSVYATEVKEFVSNGLADLSVSRQSSRLQWGIPVPNDPSQMIYVWLDALVNYLTVAGYPHNNFHWPPTHHIVGKDIVKFHAIYWPAFLMAVGLDPPKRVVVHAHWTRDTLKMSKSRGNVVDPFDNLRHWGSDVIRYYLLKDGSLHRDSDYCDDRIASSLNGDLADSLGNLLQRCTAPSLNPSQSVPPLPDVDRMTREDKTVMDAMNRLCALFL